MINRADVDPTVGGGPASSHWTRSETQDFVRCGTIEGMRSRGRSKRLDKERKIHAEVSEIMQMWRVIERRYDRLSDEERKRIEANPDGREAKFPGFAGNEETTYLRAARELAYCEFREFGGRDLNSHLPYLDAYRRMLRRFEIILSNTPTGDLSVADLIALLKELVHPSNRER